MDIFDWIKTEFTPPFCSSDRFIYDDMESQSGRCLPVIYQPFDASRKDHWCDRGSLFDFLYSTCAEGKSILDFGPGDGWPSLIVAPFVAQVTGIDGSARRVDVCTENARRMGLSNTRFLHVTPGLPFPFEENSFDAVMAASSIEQSPDPRQTLQELYRVLRPGGRLRIHYEALGGYRDGLERDLWLSPAGMGGSWLILYDRQIEAEKVYQVLLSLDAPPNIIEEHFPHHRLPLKYSDLTLEGLKELRPIIRAVRALVTTHPSGNTFRRWLQEIGFSQVLPTHQGDQFAGKLFDQIPPVKRPTNLEGVDEILRPLVKIIVEMPAPLELDPMITAVK